MGYDPRIYDAEKRKWELIRRYKNVTLEDTLPGDTIDTSRGTAYRITDRIPMDIEMPSSTHARQTVLKDLNLISGIGKKTVERLHSKGIGDLYGLREAGYSEAGLVIGEVEKDDFVSLISRVERWHGGNHPCCCSLLGMLDREDLLFFDIETMGLKYQPVFLIGIGKFVEDGFVVTQYLARDLNEEEGILQAFMDDLNRCGCLVSFNGRSFDSRFIADRLSLFGMDGDLNRPHIDLLHMSRRLWKGNIPNHKLGTVERHILGIERENDLASAMVPNYYDLYLRKGNPGPLVPILEHNHQDILSMAYLLDLIWKKRCSEQGI